jgi:hypothetical protein
MTNFDLLDAVQPSSGWYAIVGIKGAGNNVQRQQHLVETRAEVDALAARLVSGGWNVFFGVAKYASDANRKKSNVKALKAFWLDIDCGPTKAVADPKTGRPGGYVDQATGLAALRKFCKHVGLPKPIIVNSGRGLHVYWPLAQEVAPADWEPVAERLRDLCIANDLYVDAVVFETARILRIPGTYNFKDDPPTQVVVMTEGQPTDFDDFKRTLGVKPRTTMPAAIPTGRLTALGQMLQDSMGKSFAKIMRRSAKGDGCAQLLDCYQNRATLSEARWFDALSVAKFCKDKDKSIQMLSAGHPDYDPGKTVQKIAHIQGPHNCATFERNNPGLCAGCPHFGKIKNPIVLGMEVKAASEDEYAKAQFVNETTGAVETITIPPYPNPFYWGENGGIWRKPLLPEGDPVFVYHRHLYVTKRMYDPVLHDVLVMRLHLPNDGVREFIVPATKAFDKNELRKTLSGYGVSCNNSQFNLICEYLIIAINQLQDEEKADIMRTQFGWADNDSKFIVGTKEYTPDGVFYSPPSSATESIAEHLGEVGDFEKWKEVFNLYGTPGLEAHAFAALTAFGAPLLKFTGQSGAAINVIHPNSGTGKTTILHMCNSVWGNPKELCSTQKDTDNARIHKMGVHNNLPFCVDEITNMASLAFSDLIYAASNGKGKDRMEASGNKLRANTTKWQTISLFSSNAAFYEKLTGPKSTPDGEMMRLIEYKIDYTNALDVSHAKEMFDHQLLNNYGHAGGLYAQWLVRNKEEAEDTVRSIQIKIDRELKLTQRERFWSAQVASNITGGLIAVRALKLMDWDMQRIYDWACKMIIALREDVKPPVTDTASVIGDYLNRHINNVLVVNDAVDLRTNMPMLPQMEPRGELLIRYEPDTKKLYIAAKPFKADCVATQVNYKGTVEALKKSGVLIDTTVKRLSKGMKIVTPGVHCLVFDTSAGNFLNLDELIDVPTEPAQDADEADAGGGS